MDPLSADREWDTYTFQQFAAVFADARVLSNARARPLGQSAQLRAMFPIDLCTAPRRIQGGVGKPTPPRRARPAQNAGCVQSVAVIRWRTRTFAPRGKPPRRMQDVFNQSAAASGWRTRTGVLRSPPSASFAARLLPPRSSY